MQRFIDSMGPSLASGVSPEMALDVFWAFSNEELYPKLVAEGAGRPTGSSAGGPRSCGINFWAITKLPGRPRRTAVSGRMGARVDEL